MGIGIHKNSESAVGAAINTGTKAGAAAALVVSAKGLAPTAKEAFAASLTKQADLIDKFQKSGATVEQYMAKGKKTIDGVSIPGVICSTIENWKKKGLSSEQIREKLKNMENTAIEINKMGTTKALHKLEDSKQLFETGQTSKEIAFKDSAETVLNKVKDKAASFTKDITSAFKSTKGSASEKFKAAAKSANEFLNNNPAIKKGAKAALITAAAAGVITLIAKAVHSKKE